MTIILFISQTSAVVNVAMLKRKRRNFWTKNLKFRGSYKHYMNKKFAQYLHDLNDWNILLKDGLNRRATRSDFLHNGDFYQAIGPVLAMSQCFCLMPVRGISGRNVHALSFSWMNLRTWYSIIFMIMTAIDALFTVNQVVHGVLDVRNMEPIIFHVSILLGANCFLNLAQKWPSLMQQWCMVEEQMPKFQNWHERERLAKRIRSLTFILMMLSLTEHLLSTISAIHFANFCPARKDPIESYFYTSDSQLFFVFPYSSWLAWLGKAENVLLTFGWSYIDVFVMIIGIGLGELMTRITRNIERHVHESMPEAYWTRKRLQYRLVVDLIMNVDEAVSGIIMISFANNLYFICIQLLKSINTMPSVAHAIYFYFSLCFLLSRAFAVVLYVSAVNDAAQEPLALLKQVSTNAYHEEIARFANEIATDEVALTGLKFFNVTRKLALTVAGTIVTYELVLIQFHEDQKLWNCGND